MVRIYGHQTKLDSQQYSFSTWGDLGDHSPGIRCPNCTSWYGTRVGVLGPPCRGVPIATYTREYTCTREGRRPRYLVLGLLFVAEFAHVSRFAKESIGAARFQSLASDIPSCYILICKCVCEIAYIFRAHLRFSDGQPNATIIDVATLYAFLS